MNIRMIHRSFNSLLFLSLLYLCCLSNTNAANNVNYQVSAGKYHTCALDDSGVVCWGSNKDNQLSVPVLSNPRQISAGDEHTCAVDDSGVVCWGAQETGEIWRGMQVQVPSLSNPRYVTAGRLHSCALDDSGVVCWGGFGSYTDVPALSSPSQISTGVKHNCAIDDTGVVCWGSDQGSVPSLSNPRQVSVAQFHSCALDGSSVVCWGIYSAWPDSFNPFEVNLTNIRQIDSGDAHTCVLDDNGVSCWGNGFFGQNDVPTLSNPHQITAGAEHSCALDDSGVVCWGGDGFGQASPPTELVFSNINDLGTSSDDLIASFSGSQLTLPVVAVDGVSYYAELSLTDIDQFQFSLTSFSETSKASSKSSIYDSNSGILSIKEVIVGSIKYRAELDLLSTVPNIIFKLRIASPIN